jgi:hypothetical protein
VPLAEATNLGLAKMAQACSNYTYRQPAWIADWYVRPNVPAAAGVHRNAHHRHQFAAHCWARAGTTS